MPLYWTKNLWNGSGVFSSLSVCQQACNITDITQEEYKIKVYPNPIIENVTIETNSTKEYHLSLYDLSGKLIEKIEGLKGVSEIQRKLLPSGMYILSVELDDNQFIYPVIIE